MFLKSDVRVLHGAQRLVRDQDFIPNSVTSSYSDILPQCVTVAVTAALYSPKAVPMPAEPLGPVVAVSATTINYYGQSHYLASYIPQIEIA